MSAETPRSIQVNDQELNFREHVFKQFAQSKYGQKLNESIRWSRYKPDSVDNHEWQHLLGYDINNLQHMWFIYQTTRIFIENQNQLFNGSYFSREDISALLVTACIHDIGESVKGDKNFDLKTDTDEKIELSYLTHICKELFGPSGKQIADITKTVLHDKNSKLHPAFNAIENQDYVHTAKRAWRESRKTSDQNLSLHLQWLTSNSIGNTIPKLINYSKMYASPALYLDRHQHLITEIFNTISTDCFDLYEDEERKQTAINKFNSAKQEWQQFQESKLPMLIPRQDITLNP